MRIFLISLFAIHGAMHLFGFFAAFGWVQISQLPYPIARWQGIVWLSVAIAILWVLVSVWYGGKRWFVLTGLAACLSQGLLIGYGGAVGYVVLGSLVNLMLLLATGLGYATWLFAHRFYREVGAAVAGSQHPPLHDADRLQELDLAALPAPVQRYLHCVGALGQPRPAYFRVLSKGVLRPAADQPWIPYTALQYNFLNPPARLYFMRTEHRSVPVASYDRYVAGVGSTDRRILSYFLPQRMRGPAMDIAGAVAFLHDMCCLAPVTLIDPRIQWLAEEEHRVQVAFTHAAITVSAWLHINDLGELIDFVADVLPVVQPDGSIAPMTWSTPMRAFQEIHGYLLPRHTTGVYTDAAGKFVYGKTEVIRVSFDQE
jgi:hypothetical protein